MGSIGFEPSCFCSSSLLASGSPPRHLLPRASSAGVGGAATRPSLWQSCITPLVLGCILFLIGICCRQLSMLLMNEATLLLFAIFVVTCTILLSTIIWLIRNHHLHDHHARHAQQVGPVYTIGPARRPNPASPHEPDDDGAEAAAAAAAPPPDYYSALASSLPVLVAPNSGQQQAEKCPNYLASLADTRKWAQGQPEDSLRRAPKGTPPEVVIDVSQLGPPNYDEAIESQARMLDARCKR